MNDFSKKLAADNLENWPDFAPPIYNVWKQQDKSNKVDHFGNSEPRWLENLLYLYTDPDSPRLRSIVRDGLALCALLLIAELPLPESLKI